MSSALLLFAGTTVVGLETVASVGGADLLAAPQSTSAASPHKSVLTE